jgi:hypothetical protein
MNRAGRILVAVLRIVGAAALLAIVPVVMPHAWMAACHRWLGLGELPEHPVVAYLARSLSATYMFHGILLLLAAADLRRYGPLVTYIGVVFVIFGVLALRIDMRVGMPLYWTLTEGPIAICVGLLILDLHRRTRFPLPGDPDALS